jgi:alpha-glucosidase (family GH31 glycosyl hydrolase)
MGGTLYGKVWPGYAAFPDFSNPDACNWWTQSCEDFHNEIPFDGLWLDMNEAANFCAGACIEEDKVPMGDSVKNKLVYTPGARDLEDKSLSIDGVHSDGHLELDYHNLFGFMQGVASHEYFKKNQKRPFIIARSTFAGQGKYTSHWLGDNFSTYDYLRYSIPGIMSMNVFGINFVGSDICGFMGHTTEDLCQRWTNVGAFYPFARNHDAIDDVGQEPYRWSDDVQNTMRHSIRWRYALLRYYYTQMYLNSINGGMFWKPLFFEFPNEAGAYEDVERNIMIGPAIKFSPMIHNSTADTEKFKFPPGVWVNIIDHSMVDVSRSTSDITLPTTPDAINLHLRMGYIIPLQRKAEAKFVDTTKQLHDMPMGLMINLDTSTKSAIGHIMIDDGETLETEDRLVITFNITYKDKIYDLEFLTESAKYTAGETKLETIEFVAASKAGFKNYKNGKINPGKEGEIDITGEYTKPDLMTFTIPTPIEMGSITHITFSS